jgi:putative membrane-bound dehydrogenase-like protein
LVSVAWGQGYTPEEALARMEVPDGLTVSLVASEPLVRQPVAMEFDDRGRLWVIQYLQYPNPAGLERVTWDRYSRTQYDRVPEPPPRGPQGADRITILSDRDGDGRMDEGHDFVSGLNLATGLAFGHGGVFVLQVPYLLFYADKDRNDVPDGDPEVLLTGFGMEDAHSVANSLTWGPDGWLYGAQGSTVTANIQGIEFQQGVWRYHPPTKRFELFYEGGGNTWGVDFDKYGQLLASTNVGGSVMLHGEQGGYYWKSFGKHGALHNPHAFGYFEHVTHANFTGGHVAAGGIVYQGLSLPETYRDTYIAANLLSHDVYWHRVRPHGSTFESEHGGALLTSNDAWFAPCDVTMGPDGAVYVADWYDERMAHPDPDAEWDRRNGRIYRIAAAGTPPAANLNLATLPSEPLVTWLDSPSVWHVRVARRLLAERRDPKATGALYRRLRQLSAEVKAPVDDTTVLERLECLWALYVSGGLDSQLAERLLHDTNPHIRRWTVRLLGDDGPQPDNVGAAIVGLAQRERNVQVQCQLAATARRLKPEHATAIVEAIVELQPALDDPHLPLLCWWGLEQHAIQAKDLWLDRWGQQEKWNWPLAREVLLPRLIRRYVAERDWNAVGRLWKSAQAADCGALAVAALAEGLEGTLYSKTPAELEECLRRTWEEDRANQETLMVAFRLGLPAAREEVLARAMQADLPAQERAIWLTLAAQVEEPSCEEMLLKAIQGDQPEEVQEAAVRGMGRMAQESIGPALIERYDALSARGKQAVRTVLLSRAAWTRPLLLAVAEGHIPAGDFDLAELSSVARHQNKSLDAQVRKVWGAVGSGSPGERMAEVRRLTNDLRAAEGSSAAGQAIFDQHCGTCHRLFGRGNAVGPELTSANRHDRDYLLTSMVDPSAVIRKEYLNYQIVTTDGRILQGLLAEETATGATLLTAKNERVQVPRDQIEALDVAAQSLMPEQILSKLSPQELRDLFAYLQMPEPKGTPADAVQ